MRAEAFCQMPSEVRNETIVVEKRVVDIEQENDVAFVQHGRAPASPCTTVADMLGRMAK